MILSGTGRVKLGDSVENVEPMDAIRVAPAVVRQFEAGDDGLEILAFGQRHDRDGEILKEDFWGDA